MLKKIKIFFTLSWKRESESEATNRSETKCNGGAGDGERNVNPFKGVP